MDQQERGNAVTLAEPREVSLSPHLSTAAVHMTFQQTTIGCSLHLAVLRGMARFRKVSKSVLDRQELPKWSPRALYHPAGCIQPTAIRLVEREAKSDRLFPRPSILSQWRGLRGLVVQLRVDGADGELVRRRLLFIFLVRRRLLVVRQG